MKKAFAFAAMTAVLTLVSCTSTPNGPDLTEQTNRPDSVSALRSRAEKLWSAKVAEDWATVFEFQDKFYLKDGTVEQFIKWSTENEPFRTHSAKVQRVLTDGDLGWVWLQIDTSMRKFSTAPSRMVERWEKWKYIDGEWIPVHPKEYKSYPLPPAERDTAEEPKLLARWKESWKAREADDTKQLYQFSDPLDREQVTQAQFDELLTQADYQKAEVQWVQVTGNGGIVQTGYWFKLTDPSMTKLAPRLQVVGEEWVKRDNQWFLNLAANEPVSSDVTDVK